MNHLLRELAPISEPGWQALDDEARERLAPALAARKLVDFSGPHGWQHSATNLGRTEPLPAGAGATASSGLRRRVLPLVELRADFDVSRAELRDTDRGADDGDWGALDDAAHRLAVGRERRGLPRLAGRDQGIADASPHVADAAGRGRGRYPRVVAGAVERCCRAAGRPVRPGAGRRGVPAGDRDGRARRLPAAGAPEGDPRGRPDRLDAGRDRLGRAEPARRRLRPRLAARTSRSATTPTTPTSCGCISRRASASTSARRRPRSR